MSDIDLLPRADLPVIWEDFKSKAALCRATAESLTVTDVSQKEAMALARKTRLTLREIRIAVEHKRVELGEGHLKEIQKVNGAAKAIREFIEPLEARLLSQESFAERAEADRIAELALRRNAELYEIRPRVTIIKDLGTMSQENYDILLAGLRAEVAEIEAVNRLRIEAESRLAAQKLEMELREVAIREEAAKLMRAQQAEARAEQERQHAIAKEKAEAYQAELRAEWERQQAEKAAHQATLDAAKAVRDADLAEQTRIRDEQFAKLEAELNAERAAKLAEAKRVMELAIAPDVEKLWQFAGLLRGIEAPSMTTPAGISFAVCISGDIRQLATDIEATCRSWGLTTK